MDREDRKMIIIIVLAYTIFFGTLIAGSINKRIVDEDYIQNLEEKLNIYESKYDEHCLEDSIRQVQ